MNQIYTMSISNNEIKKVKSLQQKKFRDETGLFIVEGEKMVREAIDSQFKVEKAYYRSEIGEEGMKRISSIADYIIPNITEASLLTNNEYKEEYDEEYIKKLVNDLYKDYNIVTIQAKRTINSNANNRGAISEVLIRNYE
mgnify:CR=1 FL=1